MAAELTNRQIDAAARTWLNDQPGYLPPVTGSIAGQIAKTVCSPARTSARCS